MSRRQDRMITITIRTAGRQTGLTPQTVQACIERRLVVEPLRDSDLVELRRIRRLQELGINMAGIEVILHMRRQIEALRSEIVLFEQVWGSPGWRELVDVPNTAPLAMWQRLLPWEPD
jgi:hypothetical protein